MSRGITKIARHPLRAGAILGIAAITLAFLALVQAASPPSGFFEYSDANVRYSSVGTFDWANSGTGSPNTCLPGAPAGAINLPGPGGVFNCGAFVNNTTPPIPPQRTAASLADPTIVDAEFLVDPLSGDVTSCGTGDPTVYTGAGGEKNGDLLSSETFNTASVPAKDDVSNVYAISHRVESGGLVTVDEIFLGGERVVNNGDTHMDFEFLQSAVTIPDTCSGSFSGDRTAGDILASMDYTKGGTLGGFSIHQWYCYKDTMGTIGTVCNPGKDPGQFPDAHYELVPNDNVAFFTNGSGPVQGGGWASRTRMGGVPDGSQVTEIATNELMEGGINLKGLGFTGCISTFLPHTRSAQSFTATLKDFAIIPFNTCRGSILVEKLDGNGELLSGAGFEFDKNPFTGSDGPVQIDDGSADDKADGNNGLVCIDGVVPGTYQITEYKVPDGYFGDPDTETVIVGTPETNITCAERLAEDPLEPDATFTNNLGSILIHKEDGAGSDLAGAGFTFDPDPFTGGDPIEIKDGDAADQASDDGWLCIDNVLKGSYKVSEKTVPDGYFGDSGTENIEVNVASTCADRLADTPVADATFTNLLGSILIHKVDGDANDLAGAGFTFDPDPFTGGDPIEIKDGDAADQASDDGWLCIDNVLKGSYKVSEKTVPDGYFGDSGTENIEVNVASTCADRLADTPVADATFTNLLGSILIHKVNGDANDLAGAGFAFDPDPFTGGDPIEIKDGDAADQASDDGWLCIDNVLKGSYKVSEKTVPDGYFGDADTETVNVDAASTCADRLADTPVADATFTNLLGSILIHKEDGAGSDLAGAGFTFDPDPFTGGDAIEIKDGDTADQASADGWLCIDDVLKGSYKVSEKTVPDGYAPDPDTETIDVTSASTCAERLAADPLEPDATFTNLLGSILIHKVDGDANDLAGAGFTFDPDPFTGGDAIEIKDGDTADQASADGWLCIDDVLLATYKVSEKTVPDGYAPDPDTETIDVTSASTCAERLAADPLEPDATFTNLLGSILIHKVDGHANDLAGAGFTFDPNPFTGSAPSINIDDGGTEDQADADDGWLCIDDVKLGSYDVSEYKVPAGYKGDPDTETIVVDAASTCAERLADTPTADATFTNLLGSILIHKVDGDANDLAGAGYTFDPNPFTGSAPPVNIDDGGAEDQASADGWLCIDDVKLGSYGVSEYKVPSGFFGEVGPMPPVEVTSASTCLERLSALEPAPDLTFTNNKGSLLIRKEAKNKNAEGGIALLGGATFTITPNPLTGTGSLDITDDGANDAFNTTAGLLCIDDVWNLGAGSYSIVEKTAPANYQKDPDTETVAVTSPSTCSGRGTSGTPDATFTNVPLSQIEVIFTSSAGTGITTATIACWDSSNIPWVLLSPTSGTDDVDEIFAGLVPGTYTCEIVIDP